MKIHLSPTRKAITSVVIFIVMQLLAGVVASIGLSKGVPFATGMSLAVIVSGILTAALLLWLHIAKPKTFNPSRINWGQTATAIIAALAGIIATDLAVDLLSLPDLMRAEFHQMAYSPWGVLAIAIVGPVAEELVFREGIIRPLLRLRIHRWQAVLISAAVFGIIHVNPAQVPFAFAMGIILGAIYAKTRSIVLTSLLHIFNNSLAVVEMRFWGEDAATIHYYDYLGGPITTWCIVAVATVVCIISIRSFWRHYHRHPLGTRHSHHHHHRTPELRK